MAQRGRYGGPAAFSIGHGNPEVNATIASQLAQVACGYHDPMELRYPTQICRVGQGLVIKATCVKLGLKPNRICALTASEPW